MDTINCVQKAIDFIEDNILDELKPEVIASQAFMSNFHFQRVFSIICNLTLGEYIRNRRLTLAGLEIMSSDKRIIDITYRYGYESPESFSRAFTRFHGVSPTAARGRKGNVSSFPKISVNTILGGKQAMQNLTQRGYSVRENGPVYYTKDMDKTTKWFEDVLGWYADIAQRDDKGTGVYGCVLPLPGEIHNMTLVPFNGFHMFCGEPTNRSVGFMRVDSIDNLHAFVQKNGWEQISEIETQHWGGRECDVTTIDGSLIRFFELR